MKTDFPHSGRRLCDYALSGLLTGWQILCRVAINRYVSLVSLFFKYKISLSLKFKEKRPIWSFEGSQLEAFGSVPVSHES